MRWNPRFEASRYDKDRSFGFFSSSP